MNDKIAALVKKRSLNRTKEGAIRRLKKAGILDEKGNLSEPYQRTDEQMPFKKKTA